MEEWKAIKGYENLYEVSNFGRVKSLKRLVSYKDGRIRKYKEKVLNPRIDKKGYYFVGLFFNKVPAQYRVHRLVADAFIENNENKPCVNHIDSNRLNNIVVNLEWVTYSENTIHAYKKGRLVTPTAKLTKEKVKLIRELYKTGNYTQYTLADEFDVKQVQISRIINNKNWNKELVW